MGTWPPHAPLPGGAYLVHFAMAPWRDRKTWNAPCLRHPQNLVADGVSELPAQQRSFQVEMRHPVERFTLVV